MAVTITVRVTSRRSECVAENQINKKIPEISGRMGLERGWKRALSTCLLIETLTEQLSMLKTCSQQEDSQ